VVELKPDGSLDPAFGSGGRIRLYPRVGSVDPSGIVVDPQGRLVGVGWQGKVSLFRLRPDGSADRTFNGGQHLVVPYGGDKSTPYQVGLQSTGRIVALAESGGGAKGFALIALRGGTDRSRCLGHRATIVGTQGTDELTGTPRRDVIAALGGKDKVRGLGGADLICGGKGRDSLYGGAGRDRIRQ
jgi:Ca2+-binding RTX toxin-like protein